MFIEEQLVEVLYHRAFTGRRQLSYKQRGAFSTMNELREEIMCLGLEITTLKSTRNTIDVDSEALSVL